MTSSEYTPEKLQRMLADVITNRFPLADVTLLLRAGADADGPVTRGLRPLHYAAYENDVQVEREIYHIWDEIFKFESLVNFGDFY